MAHSYSLSSHQTVTQLLHRPARLGDMANTTSPQSDHDLQETAELMRRSEERVLQEGIEHMNAVYKRYTHAEQAGKTALAKQLRREYYQELFMNVLTAASPMELLFPEPQLQAMMDTISHEL